MREFRVSDDIIPQVDKNTKKKYPTLFVLEGGIRMYDKSMRLLYTKITIREWEIIVPETVECYLFMRALKEVGMPRLHEPWTKLLEFFLRGLWVNIGRMKNIDPLLVARVDQEAVLKAYKQKMEQGAEDFMEEARQIHEDIRKQSALADISMVTDL